MLATWGCTTFPKPTLSLDFLGATSLDSGITFSRGSQATLFDSTGTLVYAKHNLLTFSEDFANAAWTTADVTVSANSAVAPDGTTTADKLIESAVTALHVLYRNPSYTSGLTYTATVFAKAAERTQVHVQVGGISAFGALTFAVFDLSTQTVVNTSNSPTTTIENIGNGWFRLSVTKTATATGSPQLQIGPAVGGTANYAGDGTSGIFIWGAQLNLANMEGGVTSSLTTYYPTTTAAYYAPRFDYNPSTLQPRGLLIEEQRTNSIRNNTMQGAVAGTPGTLPTNWLLAGTAGNLSVNVIGTGTENGITYIDLQLVGTPNTSSNRNILFESNTQIAATSGQNWASSFYVKLVGGSLTNVSCSIEATGRAASTGGLTEIFAAANFTPTTAALSTQRVTVNGTTASGSTAFVNLAARFNYTNGLPVDITLRIGLPQLELGAFATSVIPTTTTALTRNADVASMTGTNFSSWFNAAEGTLIFNGVTNASNGGFATLDDGSAANYMRLGRGFDKANYLISITAGTQADIYSITNITLGSQFRMAATYKTNDAAISLNGATAVTDTSVTLPTPDRLRIGFGLYTSYINGHIQRIAYYPTRLPNTTLQALTA